MSGCSYRPRPTNGSGDSPRPPFLTEFVNHISKLALAGVVYHLFGCQIPLRIHPHIKGAFSLKTESASGILQLHGADPEIGEHAVERLRSNVLLDLREA